MLTSLLQRLRHRLQPQAAGEGQIDRFVMVIFTAASVYASGCGIISNFMLLRWVPPREMGMWQLALLIPFYSQFIAVGVLQGLMRELPFAMGKGDQELEQNLADTALSWVMMISIIVILSGLALSLFWPGLSVEWRLLFASSFAFAGLQQQTVYWGTLYRSSQAFKALAGITFMFGTFQLLSVVFVYYGQLWGLAARAILVTIFFFIMLFIKRPLRPRIAFHPKAFSLLLKTGFLFMLFGYGRDFLLSIDRLLLGSVAAPEVVGYYTVVNYLYTGVAFIPMSLGMYVYPKMSYRYGQTGSRRSLWGMVWKLGLLMLVVGLPTVALGIVGLHFIIPRWAPQYTPGLKMTLLAGVGAWIYSASILTSALHTIKAMWSHYILLAIVAASLAITWWLSAGVDPLWRVTLASVVIRASFVIGGFLLLVVAILFHKDEPKNESNAT